MKIVVPMAGRGTRYSQLKNVHKDFAVPKPMINILGEPMIFWAISSFHSFLQKNDNDMNKPVKMSDLIFICLREHDRDFGIANFLEGLFSKDVHIIFTEKVTRGPAETAMLCKPFVDPEESVIFSDSDHHFDATSYWQVINQRHKETNFLGILPLIRPEDTEPTWSYVELNERNEVINIKEKDPELAKRMAYGVIGAYYFYHAKDFFREAHQMIQDQDMVGDKRKKEFYISRICQRYIRKRALIKTAFVQKGWLLGTPKFLDRFLKDYLKGRVNS